MIKIKEEIGIFLKLLNWIQNIKKIIKNHWLTIMSKFKCMKNEQSHDIPINPSKPNMCKWETIE